MSYKRKGEMSGECEICGELGFECKCTKKEKIDWFIENYKREALRKKEEFLSKIQEKQIERAKK